MNLKSRGAGFESQTGKIGTTKNNKKCTKINYKNHFSSQLISSSVDEFITERYWVRIPDRQNQYNEFTTFTKNNFKTVFKNFLQK